ncbi:MAG: NADP-dependent oxidoreductase [Steroidobacteraceae bacterium]
MPRSAAGLIGCLAALILAPAASVSADGGTAMRAAVVNGGRLVMRSVPRPVPSAGEVRIEVRAASVNPADWKMKRMKGPMGPDPILGLDAAGTIDALGPAVAGWRVGEAVIAVTRPPHGAYAQYTVASVHALARKPRALTFDEAAGIPVAGITAWHSIVDIAHVLPGERILIDGGAGGVGSAAVQVAKARGAYVIATALASNTAYLHSIGADEVIDYSAGPFEKKVKNLDVVLDTVSVADGIRAIRTLKPGALLISLVGPIPAARCAAARIRCEAPHGSGGLPAAPILDHVVALANAGKYRVSVEHVFPLADAAQAWQLSEAGHTRGKLVLSVAR